MRSVVVRWNEKQWDECLGVTKYFESICPTFIRWSNPLPDDSYGYVRIRVYYE